MFVAYMLVHYFWLLAFKLVFKFICLNALLKIKMLNLFF
jgi:hypothetical protein